MQSNNISPELNTQLRRQIPAIVLAANPDIRPGQQIQSLFDTSATLSGPILRGRRTEPPPLALARVDRGRSFPFSRQSIIN